MSAPLNLPLEMEDFRTRLLERLYAQGVTGTAAYCTGTVQVQGGVQQDAERVIMLEKIQQLKDALNK